MEPISPKKLIPGKNYLLKWVGNNKKNIIILECEFIKYYDDSFYVDFEDYLSKMVAMGHSVFRQEQIREEMIPIANRLVENNIFEINNPSIFKEYPFDNPLYPYRTVLMRRIRFRTIEDKIQNKNIDIGLFKYIGLKKIIINGKDNTSYFNGNKPITIYNLIDILAKEYVYNTPEYWESYHNFNHLLYDIDTNTFDPLNNTATGRRIVPNESLFWTDISNFQVIMANVKERITHYKGLKGLERKIGLDPAGKVAEFVGSTEYLQPLYKRGGKKSRKYKNKSSKRKIKKTKSKRRY